MCITFEIVKINKFFVDIIIEKFVFKINLIIQITFFKFIYKKQKEKIVTQNNLFLFYRNLNIVKILVTLYMSIFEIRYLANYSRVFSQVLYIILLSSSYIQHKMF